MCCDVTNELKTDLKGYVVMVLGTVTDPQVDNCYNNNSTFKEA
jgi:hypothetical protein